MAVTTKPFFVASINIGKVKISTANTNTDGTGTLGTLFTAGSDGAVITSILVKAEVTTSLGMVRFYYYDGTTTFMFYEQPVSATTKSASVPAFYAQIIFQEPIRVAGGHIIKVSTEKAESFSVVAFGGNY